MYDAARRAMASSGVVIVRSLVGNYVTSLDMAGCSITLSLMDDEVLSLWDAPVHTRRCVGVAEAGGTTGTISSTPREHVPFSGMMHGFFGLLGIAGAAEETHARAGRALRDASCA